MVVSEFGANNMKPWIHPLLSAGQAAAGGGVMMWVLYHPTEHLWDRVEHPGCCVSVPNKVVGKCVLLSIFIMYNIYLFL